MCFAEGDAGAGGAGAGATGTGSEGAGGQGGAGGAGAPEPFAWKDKLSSDVANSPLFQGYDNSVEGLNKAAVGYASLEKLLGHEKVPIPKNAEDTEGWARFSKAMGVPDAAEGYGLADAEVPDSMKGMTFDKAKFAETIHAFKLTPNQAKGLWEAYTNMTKEAYSNAVKAHEAKMTEVVNAMRGEWGDTYDSNVQLGQLVINKFSADKETEEFLTATLAKDPRGVRFLAKVGAQFAENKIGDFKHQRFSLSADQAQEELDKIRRDPNHPYLNPNATDAEHQRAVDYVNSLEAVVNKAKG